MVIVVVNKVQSFPSSPYYDALDYYVEFVIGGMRNMTAVAWATYCL